MRTANNPWDILGIQQSASLEDAKAAYKRLALVYHPDRGGDGDDFKRIHDAYETLKERKHIPILSKPNTELVNIKLSIPQQINGLKGMIDTRSGVLDVAIPPGACDGDKYKVRSQGKNYIINVQELKHKNFTRQGFNVIMHLQIDAVSAMKGGICKFKDACEEEQQIKIDPGTPSDTLIVLKGLGLLNPKNKKRGDLHVYTVTRLPILDTAQKINEFIERLKNE
jgi:DnaJ-class molecular chaperone